MLLSSTFCSSPPSRRRTRRDRVWLCLSLMPPHTSHRHRWKATPKLPTTCLRRKPKSARRRLQLHSRQTDPFQKAHKVGRLCSCWHFRFPHSSWLARCCRGFWSRVERRIVDTAVGSRMLLYLQLYRKYHAQAADPFRVATFGGTPKRTAWRAGQDMIQCDSASHSFCTFLASMRGPKACILPFFLPLIANATPLLSSRASSSSGGYANPQNGGGSMLTNAYNGFGEPINVIVSGNSDAQVLTAEGFLNYALSIDFGTECLGQHLGRSGCISVATE